MTMKDSTQGFLLGVSAALAGVLLYATVIAAGPLLLSDVAKIFRGDRAEAVAPEAKLVADAGAAADREGGRR